jgi:hypothetical protein
MTRTGRMVLEIRPKDGKIDPIRFYVITLLFRYQDIIHILFHVPTLLEGWIHVRGRRPKQRRESHHS